MTSCKFGAGKCVRQTYLKRLDQRFLSLPFSLLGFGLNFLLLNCQIEIDKLLTQSLLHPVDVLLKCLERLG